MTAGIRGIAFDAFGTLVTTVGRSGPYQRLGRRADVDPRGFRMMAMTRNIALGDLAAELGQAEIAHDLKNALEEELAGVGLYPDAAECLSYLDTLGIPYVVCSNLANGYGEKVRRLVPKASGYVFSYEVGAAKPDRAMYVGVAEALGMAAPEIFFTGDTRDADVVGPLSFGMHAVKIDRKSGEDLLSIVRHALSDAVTGDSIR
jgi:HAD superfamily hydrolase (TIGR01549 family)